MSCLPSPIEPIQRRRGRNRSLSADAEMALYNLYNRLGPEDTVEELARSFNVCRRTVYIILDRVRTRLKNEVAPVSSNDSGGSTVPEGEPQSQTRPNSTLPDAGGNGA